MKKILKKTVIVEYYSNNSGGYDWLTDEQWSALEEAGWKLFGFEDFLYESGSQVLDETDDLPARKGERSSRPKYALKRFTPLFPETQAKSEFERVTGASVDEEGCECCGRPHSFTTH